MLSMELCLILLSYVRLNPVVALKWIKVSWGYVVPEQLFCHLSSVANCPGYFLLGIQRSHQVQSQWNHFMALACKWNSDFCVLNWYSFRFHLHKESNTGRLKWLECGLQLVSICLNNELVAFIDDWDLLQHSSLGLCHEVLDTLVQSSTAQTEQRPRCFQPAVQSSVIYWNLPQHVECIN